MSKKTLISAVTAVLVVGAASTTFAAANPFSDVPADSWAYDAVATLAADGVVDGYPDGTYKGQNTMTRYEMAQIIARAMAKTDLEKADKALVDKLAAEFAEELDNLGVRVADLEKKSDNVKFTGELRYRYYDVNDDSEVNDGNFNKIMFRLEPKAYIGNSGWTANARIGYQLDAGTSSNAAAADDTNDNDATVDRIFVNGPLFGADVTAGKFGGFNAQGLVFDDRLTGAQFVFGSDVFKTTAFGGRYNSDPTDAYDSKVAKDITGDIYGVQFDYTPNDKLALNAGYTQLNGIDSDFTSNGAYVDKAFSEEFQKDITGVLAEDSGYDSNKAKIWSVGGSYAFNSNIALVGQYAQNTEAEDYDDAWSAELQYKGADPADAGSWGMYAGYRDIGNYSVIAPTYDDIIGAGYKGFVAGVSYVPAENILATVRYFDGKNVVADDYGLSSDAQKIFGEVEFFF